MSDIDMRFDGILILAALLLGAAIYLLIVLSAIGIMLCNKPARPRARRVAVASGLMTVGTLFGFLILFGYWSESGTAHFGIDWFDLGVVPWGVIFALGCWVLTKLR
jgi:hypothetical protein